LEEDKHNCDKTIGIIGRNEKPPKSTWVSLAVAFKGKVCRDTKYDAKNYFPIFLEGFE
jgi:hypothetical protein